MPLFCDASSDIFSRPIDVSKYGLIYAGSQKNLGPAGVTLVIIRKDLVERGSKDLPVMLQYRTHAKEDSCYNTPPTFPIYAVGQVFKWILKQGALRGWPPGMRPKPENFTPILTRASCSGDGRPRQPLTDERHFRHRDEKLDEEFVAFAKERKLDGLKGHRSVGGMRASIYNAFPEAESMR